ncbi:Transporter [Flavobacterium longum]|uniref:hypothetical protein n=1 Tax=Flavobacterium longum TaxID=1299340 RepID=UPI0039EA8B59
MRTIFTILFCIGASGVWAQGCSDAGICSFSAPHDTIVVKKNTLEITAVAGAGDADTKYFSPFISYTRGFRGGWQGSVKITSSLATGQFGERASIGDAFLTASYAPASTKPLRWSYSGGAKIPFNRANLKINNHPLPLDYQSSLGTFDLLASVNVGFRSWDFSGAVQIPVIDINANSYFAEYSGTDDFPTTNGFKRRPDGLLRATYTLDRVVRGVTFKPNLLAIYHLGDDTYEDVNGQRRPIDGSRGLTINGNLIVEKNLTSGSIILSLATPFVVRDARPDGLTRSFTAALGYIARF